MSLGMLLSVSESASGASNEHHISAVAASASETSTQVWAVIVIAALACLPILVNFFTGKGRRTGSYRPLRDLMIRVASFDCPDCDRPICQLGASKALILRVSRNSPTWQDLDEDKLTPRQQVGPEAIWIHTECPFCQKHVFFDEFGDFTGDPLPPIAPDAAPALDSVAHLYEEPNLHLVPS